MKEKLLALLIKGLSADQKYAIAVELDLTGAEAKEMLDFDCHQYGLPLREPEVKKDEKPKA